MRSELIFGALTHISNRYQLCQLASKATRKLHKPNTRLQDTMNDVLLRFREQARQRQHPLVRNPSPSRSTHSAALLNRGAVPPCGA